MVSHETNGVITHQCCPVCGNKTLIRKFTASSYRISTEEFNVDVCTNCGHGVTNPVPDQEAIGEYYKSENYISHTNASKSLMDLVYQNVRKFALSKKEALVNRYLKEKKNLPFLDYGAGTGHFVNKMIDCNWNAFGLEISKEARDNANNNVKSKLFDIDYLNEIENNSISGFSMWHVLEHIYEPKKLLSTFYNKLDNGGYGFIALPNYESLDAKVYKEHWAALDVPIHFSHYTKNSLRELIEGQGYKLIEVINMPFDAYYISILSEKLKKGRNDYISAFINGLKSNLKGKKTQNTSSLIYVIKKA